MDTKTGIWSALPDLPTGVSQVGAAVVNGKLLVVGVAQDTSRSEFGSWNLTTPILQIFDGTHWTVGRPPPVTTRGVRCSTVELGDGRLFCSFQREAADIHVYDLADDAWTTMRLPFMKVGDPSCVISLSLSLSLKALLRC